MKLRFAALLLALSLALGLCALPAVAEESIDLMSLYKIRDTDAAWSAANAIAVDLNSVTGNNVTLTAAGDYVLSGSYSGQVVVEAPEDAKVRLILNGVSIVSPEGPAIYEKQANKLIVTLAENTRNTLTDGPAVADGDDTIGAALYAEDDLSVNGSGALTVTGTAKHGIQSKADLILAGGDITVTAVTDGIRGRNSVLLLDGRISVTAGGDGLAATRTDKESKGWVVLAGGALSVTTGSGAGTPRASANSRGGMRGGCGGWNGTAGTASADSGVSQKAVKAATDLTVLGGNYTFDCADDGLHGVNVTVNGGSFTIRTGDDGMHADSELTVNGGVIRIDQCYEGLEGANVTVNGGEVRVIASDDGINASGGGDSSGFGGRGGDRFGGSSGMLTIAGGQVEVTAGGDGLDSNGSLTISGGVVGVCCATTQGEGAIDFNGSGTFTGGTILLASNGGYMTSGMSGVTLIAIPMAGSGAAGDEITLATAEGTVSFTPQSGFTSLAVAGNGTAQGQSVTVTVGGRQAFSGAVTADMAVSGNMSGFGGGRGGFGRNGFGRNGGDTDGTTEPGSADGLGNGQPAPGDRGFGGGKRRGR